MGKILVTGVTGLLGRIVLDKLLSKVPASNVKVLVRDEAKAAPFRELGVEVAIGSYDDKTSLVNAFKDVDKLYFVSGSDTAKRGQQHENVVSAAIEAKVGHVVYTSFQRKNETETSPIYFVASTHLLTERLLQSSGLKYTILKHGIYTEMIPIFIGDRVLETGVIFQPAGEGKTAFILRSDLAEAGVAVLTGQGHENRSYELTGPAAVSFEEIAAKISAVTGKNVSYVSPTPEVFTAELTKAGVPAEYIGLFAGFSEATKEGEFASISTDLEKLTGRKGGSVEAFLEQVYGK
ncbi:SDR family oxidoreductase [Chitinophaga ginsengisoli]|uniref:NAD(P)H dehydrogenase (Quinone) n=1 Tax=Chitinophaga ginsengisoli TaxID=363837 RepID=A0A2P8GN91_9BACT|nr:SDR family oxidoreductase [Chitinophaga ginsengisoli]PSL35433.1 NAD(P)H dehydrogenase (quinone) [Chitinophaga ginsengisoli]